MVQVLNATFDGVTDVARLPTQSDVSWNGSFIGYYSVFYSVPNDLLRANVSLTGSNWTVKTLRFGAETKNKTNITDLDNSGGRRIDFLELGFNSDVELISTRVRYIYGWDGDKHEVKLGDQQSGSTSSINLYAKENIVTTGNAWVQSINTGGDAATAIGDTITIGSGGAGSIRTGSATDKVTTTTGYVGSIFTGDGKDTVKTGASYVEFIHTGDHNDKVTIGAGGAETVKTGSHNDTVITGTGWVGSITTGGGDDKVTLGSGSAGFIYLGNGDDTLFLKPTDADGGVVVFAGAGEDTINFSKFKTGVVFSLSQQGEWQNPAAPNGDLELTGQGYVLVQGVENVVGTNKGDVLTGDSSANTLTGRKGADVLAGLKGNDILIGGGGKDTFVFADGGGTDRVKDYNQADDTLQIADHVGGFASLTISDQGANLKIVYDGGTILLLGEAGTVLTAADFDFV